MRLLRLAIEKQRWDLATHTLVLATARILNNGDKPRASRSKEQNLRSIIETSRSYRVEKWAE